jgi:hypothetical protein
MKVSTLISYSAKIDKFCLKMVDQIDAQKCQQWFEFRQVVNLRVFDFFQTFWSKTKSLCEIR